MLAHVLHETNHFGFPLEYANPGYLQEWKKVLGTSSVSETLRELLRNRTSPNGVFGIKVHYWQIRQLGGFAGMKELFPDPYYVLLSRRNVLKQAISWSIAAQTGVWIDGQREISTTPQYDYNDINWRLRRTILYNASWRYLLVANACQYLDISFEEAVENTGDSVRRIAQFMNLDLDVGVIPDQPVTKKQGSSLNNDWERRFLLDYEEGELLKGRISKFAPRNDNRLKGLLLRAAHTGWFAWRQMRPQGGGTPQSR
jgi:LPS sulfotransferase NodH